MMADKYKENREIIKKKLYEINTTLDKEAAYERMVDYVMAVAEKSWTEASRCYGWEMQDIEGEIKTDLVLHGIKPEKNKS